MSEEDSNDTETKVTEALRTSIDSAMIEVAKDLTKVTVVAGHRILHKLQSGSQRPGMTDITKYSRSKTEDGKLAVITEAHTEIDTQDVVEQIHMHTKPGKKEELELSWQGNVIMTSILSRYFEA